jgi:signal transduction histidine kinase
MAETPLRILLIDDDEDDFVLAREVLADTLGHPFTATWASSYEAGLRSVREGGFDVVLLDYRLGRQTGVEFLREPEIQSAGIPVILLTGQGERTIDLEAMQAGAADFLPKRHLQESLERTVRHALERHRDREALRQMNELLEQRVAERTVDLERANSALKDADRRKDEFIAILAHELRNPLAPIVNALSLMQAAEEDLGLCREARSTLERQVGHMVRLVDDLLEVSRLSQGKIELRKSEVVLSEVVHQAIEIARPAIERSEQELVVSLWNDPIRLWADPTRLTQIIGNLLNNASKFTPERGRIEVATRRDGDIGEITVRDAGIGIEPLQLPRIFDLFTQLDSSLERTQGGLGIGLTLVKNLVQMHGGSVEARSEGRNRGSEFVVRLPVESSSPTLRTTTPAPASKVASSHHRILVVDDNRDSANTLAMLLKLSKHDVVTAYDGVAAVEAFQKSHPDVVLMDIGLPGMSGLDAARAIRSLPEGGDVSLVAMTGWGQDEDRERTRDAGFDRHLVKPVDRAALMQLLAELPAKQ